MVYKDRNPVATRQNLIGPHSFSHTYTSHSKVFRGVPIHLQSTSQDSQQRSVPMCTPSLTWLQNFALATAWPQAAHQNPRSDPLDHRNNLSTVYLILFIVLWTCNLARRSCDQGRVKVSSGDHRRGLGNCYPSLFSSISLTDLDHSAPKRTA